MVVAARQLDIIADTALAADPQWRAPSASSSLTVVRQKPAAPSASSNVDPRIVTINRQREARGIPHDKFARLAGVSIWTWRDLRRGRRAPLPATLTKLETALVDQPRGEKPPQIIAAFHRVMMQMIALRMGFDIAALLATDFSVQRPSNPEWLQAARIRQMAIYLTTVELEVSNAELGRAIGVTRANIKFARDEVEQRREDGNEIDMVLTAVALQVKGAG